MNPEIWGPRLWFFIHTIAINFPDNPTREDYDKYLMFFKSLKHIIPCEKCRIGYIEKTTKNPVNNHLKNSTTLFNYTIDLHNEVNRSLGKKELTYEEASIELQKIYSNEQFTNKPVKSKPIENFIRNPNYQKEQFLNTDDSSIEYMKILKYILIILLLLSILFYALKFKNII